MKVLVATDDLSFNVGLTNEYVRRGCDVHVGIVNLFLKQQSFDLIHCHWPEELTYWCVPPDPDRVARVLDCLDHWRTRSTLVGSVHNLLPHQADQNDQATYRYYDAFLGRMHHIGHFSETSRERVLATFPAIPADRHFVHGMNLFSEMRALSPGRAAARAGLGLEPDRFVVATFGQLRSLAEVELVQAALDAVRGVDPVMLFAGRLPFEWGRRRLILNHMRRRRWLKRHDVRTLDGYLTDADTAAVFEAVDALIVPRFGRHLNSGLMPLAMTFGTPLAAPDYGVYREYLAGSGNALYTPADPAALARAIEQLAGADRDETRRGNLAWSAGWGWPTIVDRILAATGKA